jgi:hypothetical protein
MRRKTASNARGLFAKLRIQLQPRSGLTVDTETSVGSQPVVFIATPRRNVITRDEYPFIGNSTRR